MFKHAFVPRTEITDTTTEAGRVYHTPDGDFNSVTTIIGRKLDHSGLDAWKERVGEAEARAVGTQAAYRGTQIHSIAEKYVMNDPNWKAGAMPVNLFTFMKLKPIIDKGVELIYGIEYPLWSTLLKTAGRSDLPCVFAGKNTILDYKTSKRNKTRAQIEGYFIQATCYSLMFEERTGIKMPQLAIVFAVDDGQCQLFVDQTRNWYERVRQVFCA